MRLSQVIKLFLIFSFISCACGVSFIDQDSLDVESVARSICDINKGVDSQVGHVDTIGSLLTYLENLPPRHKLSACRNKYLDSIKELNELVVRRKEDVCSDSHLKKIEEFHKAYVSKISKHVRHRKANQVAAPWLLVMFFMHYVSATSNYCEARAVESLVRAESGVQRSNEFVEVERLLKQFTETLGMKAELSQWNKDVFLIWNLVDNLPLESSKKFRKYLADGDERLFIRIQETEQLINLQKFCSKLKHEYEDDLLPLIRLADMGYFRAGESKLNKNPSLSRQYMMIQMCETLLPIRVLEDDGSLKPGQIVLVPVEEGKQLNSQMKTSPQSRPFPRPGPSFRFAIDQETADVEINTLLDTVKFREKTMNRLVKNMARNVAQKIKSKAGQLLVRDGKKNEDYGSMMESSFSAIEKDESDWSELDESSLKGGLIRNKRGVGGFFKAWVDLAFNIIDGIAFTIGIVFLYAIKVALVFIVFIYKLGRSLTGIGYGPVENMFEYVWNGGFRITREDLDLSKDKNKFDFDSQYDIQHHHGSNKHLKIGAKHNNHHQQHKDFHDNHNHLEPHSDHLHHKANFDNYHNKPHFDRHHNEPHFDISHHKTHSDRYHNEPLFDGHLNEPRFDRHPSGPHFDHRYNEPHFDIRHHKTHSDRYHNEPHFDHYNRHREPYSDRGNHYHQHEPHFNHHFDHRSPYHRGAQQYGPPSPYYREQHYSAPYARYYPEQLERVKMELDKSRSEIFKPHH